MAKFKSKAPSGMPGVADKQDKLDSNLLTMPQGARSIGINEITKAAEILTKYKDGKTNLERRLIEDERWYQLNHWEIMRSKQKVAAGEAPRADPTSAWLFNTIANKHADAMDNYPEPNVLPREQSDEEDAKSLSDILPVIRERNEYEKTYSDNAWEKLKHGTAAYGTFWNNDLENTLGDIDIVRLDLLNLFWEPGIEDIQKSRNFFIVNLVDNDMLQAEFPDILREGENLGSVIDVAKYVYDDYVDTSEKSAVVDWYYKVRTANGRKILQYCKFVGTKLLFSSENYQDPETGEYIYAERGFYDHGKYPVVFDTLWPEKGTPVGFGYVAICKDPQLYIDRLGGAILENAIAGATPRYFARDDAGINEDEFLNLNNKIVHYSGQSLAEDKLRPIESAQLNGNYISVLQMKIDEMKETASNRDFSSGGASSGVTAAAAIAALQEAGNKQSRDTNSGSYRADVQTNYMVIELIRQFYNEERSFRITGKGNDGRPSGYEFVQYSNKGIQDQVIPAAVPGAEPMIRRPVFDIKVSAQRRNPYNQLAQNEQAKEMYKLGAFNPEKAQESLMMLDMMEFEGIDKIRDQVSQGQTMLTLLQQTNQQVQMLMAYIQMVTGKNMGLDQIVAASGQVQPQSSSSPATSQESAAMNAQRANQTPYAQKIANSTNKSAMPT